MTTLEAVNEMLEVIQQPAVTALDTGGTSDEGEAETILDSVRREVLKRGWAVNTELDVAYGVPDTKIAVSGGAGTFQFGETVTESVSGATGTFSHILAGFMYLNSVSGTFTGAQTLTGGTSGATRTGATYTAITTSQIAYNADEILRAYPDRLNGETANVVPRGGYFFDTDDNTYDFTSGLTMKIVRLLDLDELTDALANYVVKAASWRFLKYKMPGSSSLNLRAADVVAARLHALQEDHDVRGTSIHNTHRGREFLGDRMPLPPGA